MLLLLKALNFLKGMLWIQACGCKRAQTASSLLQKNLSSENLTQRLTWHILNGINLLSQHCSLFPSHYFWYPGLHPLSHWHSIFCPFCFHPWWSLLLAPTTRSNSTDLELMLILNIHFLRFILACPRICSGKGNQSENEVIAHFLFLSPAAY